MERMKRKTDKKIIRERERGIKDKEKEGAK